MPKFIEMDQTVTLADQLKDEGGPVVLINTFIVPPADADSLLAAWTADAEIMTRQPGFVSTQLHRGIAGSGVFLNYAVWDSVADFRARLSDYPASATASPHLFRKMAVPGICEA
jgi:heme-degrading monooxygenase HmoA